MTASRPAVLPEDAPGQTSGASDSTVPPSSARSDTSDSEGGAPANSHGPRGERKSLPRVAMIGNPNVGKTSLFNRLTNLLAKTSNFAGTTIERRAGTVELPGGRHADLIDLPGLYSLEASSPEEEIARTFLSGRVPEQHVDQQTAEELQRALAKGPASSDFQPPDAVIIVVDATNLQRSLFIARETLRLGLPCVVAINLIETARRRGIEIDTQTLARKLGCPVVGVSARTGEGLPALKQQIGQLLRPSLPLVTLPQAEPGGPETTPAAGTPVGATDVDDSCGTCGTCPFADGHRWAATLARESTRSGWTASDQSTDRADRWLTHPLLGPLAFIATMLATFTLVFWVAQRPMEWLDALFGGLAGLVADWLPEGDLQSLLTDGIIGGVGGVMVFLPQICILFFALAVLEDSGYLARAVVVIDRLMRRVGLPGQAFVPLLAAHACAIPAIMSTRVIQNRRDRLASIMVIPLMTCSARLPVYSMIAAMLFPDQPLQAAGLFAAAYSLGMVAAFVMAWLLKRTVLPGQPAPLIMDLPPYRMPSFGNAARHAYERGWMFLRDAGTIILLISIGIWVLSTYPKLSEEQFASNLDAAGVEVTSLPESQVDHLFQQQSQEYALIGRAGKLVAPVFAPLGFDWKTSVGVMTSFAAREVVVSTLSILYGLGPEPEEEQSLVDRLSTAERADGSRVFTTATSISLLVFFVLAMQCLPTQAVTRKETGSWGWAAFQFGYMTLLAYGVALIAYQSISRLT